MELYSGIVLNIMQVRSSSVTPADTLEEKWGINVHKWQPVGYNVVLQAVL